MEVEERLAIPYSQNNWTYIFRVFRWRLFKH